jgi:hypothetical protein
MGGEGRGGEDSAGRIDYISHSQAHAFRTVLRSSLSVLFDCLSI